MATHTHMHQYPNSGSAAHPSGRSSSGATAVTAAPSSAGGGGDILSMLVSIYGSQDMFVTEVRLLLAERLLGSVCYVVWRCTTYTETLCTLSTSHPPYQHTLILYCTPNSNLDYNTDKEVQNLELLKLRFGDQALHDCEIMVRPWRFLYICTYVCEWVDVVYPHHFQNPRVLN